MIISMIKTVRGPVEGLLFVLPLQQPRESRSGALPLVNRPVQRVVLLHVFGICLSVHMLPEILEQPLEVVVCAGGDYLYSSPVTMSPKAYTS